MRNSRLKIISLACFIMASFTLVKIDCAYARRIRTEDGDYRYLLQTYERFIDIDLRLSEGTGGMASKDELEVRLEILPELIDIHNRVIIAVGKNDIVKLEDIEMSLIPVKEAIDTMRKRIHEILLLEGSSIGKSKNEVYFDLLLYLQNIISDYETSYGIPLYKTNRDEILIVINEGAFESGEGVGYKYYRAERFIKTLIAQFPRVVRAKAFVGGHDIEEYGIRRINPALDGSHEWGVVLALIVSPGITQDNFEKLLREIKKFFEDKEMRIYK